MDLALDLEPGLGRRAALEAALRAAIVEGRLAAGTRLPSSRSLAEELGVARATVVGAFEQLAAEGYLVARRGSGTRVADVQVPVAGPALDDRGRAALAFDLLPGEPDLGSFPRAQWVASVRRALSTGPDSLLGYEDLRGAPILRAALAGYLARVRSVVVDPARVIVVPGFSGAVPLLADALASVGVRTVAMEDPCLPPHARAMAAAGQDLRPTPVDEDGLRVQDLDDAGAVLCTPTHQFPLGVALSPARRSALVGWAHDTGAWIIEDDYDGEFRFDRHPVGALQGLDPSRIVYAGTASKSLAPGLGIAWLVVPPALVEPVVEARRRRRSAVSSVEQAALADFITSGRYDRHVRRMRQRYRRRRDAVLEVLAPRFPVIGVSAGLHVTALTDGEDELVERAVTLGAALFGVRHHVLAEQTWRGIVVGYSRPSAHGFAAALDRLAAIVEDA